MARILLAWELGGGLGHTVRIDRLNKELTMRGHAVSVALPHKSHAQRLKIAGNRISIVPQWPGIVRRYSDRKGISWTTYGDMLADIIFTDEEEIASHLAVWRRVFADTKPDVVIADYAPGAVLAARGHMRLVNVGDGYTLPPHEMESFPRLWPGEKPPRHQEAEVAQRISAALARLGARPLSSYPDMNAATAHATMTIPLLDVYREWRKGGWLGAGPYTLPRIPQESRAGLFATLHEDWQFDMRLVEGIAESGVGGMVMVPNLLRKGRKLLAEAGFQTPRELQPLDQALEPVRVLMHHGGMGGCAAGIGKGLPQLIIYYDLEKYHNGKAIVGAGAGIAFDHKRVTKGEITEGIRDLARDPAYAQKASELAKENHAVLKNPSIGALADLAEGIL